MSVRSAPIGRRESVLSRVWRRLWPTAEPVPTTDLSKDEMFDALSVKRRRLVVRFVVEELEDGEHVVFSDLVNWVTAEINDTEPRLAQGKQRKNVYTALKQAHLPRLEKKGVITIEERGDVIREGPNAAGLHYQMEVSELVTVER